MKKVSEKEKVTQALKIMTWVVVISLAVGVLAGYAIWG